MIKTSFTPHSADSKNKAPSLFKEAVGDGLPFSNLLLISGSGRERGKTLLACNIIRKWKAQDKIIAVKISAHIHEDPASLNVVVHSEGFTIWEEKTISSKDSGRFLEAGADKVFYIEAVDQYLLQAFQSVYGICGDKALIICESGGLGKFISPGVMLFVQHENDNLDMNKEVLRQLSHRVIFSSSPELSDPALFLSAIDHRWKLIST
jgi:hypothetical protein